MAREAVGTIRPTPAAEAVVRAEIRTPSQLAWRQLRKHRFALGGGAVLVILYFMAIFAEFLAPYSLDFADRSRFFHPPIVPKFYDAQGFSLRPFVHDTTLVDPGLRTYAPT
ncbi:MAG: hypothetical protein ACRDGN_09760, partial [bacterium]